MHTPPAARLPSSALPVPPLTPAPDQGSFIDEAAAADLLDFAALATISPEVLTASAAGSSSRGTERRPGTVTRQRRSSKRKLEADEQDRASLLRQARGSSGRGGQGGVWGRGAGRGSSQSRSQPPLPHSTQPRPQPQPPPQPHLQAAAVEPRPPLAMTVMWNQVPMMLLQPGQLLPSALAQTHAAPQQRYVVLPPLLPRMLPRLIRVPHAFPDVRPAASTAVRVVAATGAAAQQPLPAVLQGQACDLVPPYPPYPTLPLKPPQPRPPPPRHPVPRKQSKQPLQQARPALFPMPQLPQRPELFPMLPPLQCPALPPTLPPPQRPALPPMLPPPHRPELFPMLQPPHRPELLPMLPPLQRPALPQMPPPPQRPALFPMPPPPQRPALLPMLPPPQRQRCPRQSNLRGTYRDYRWRSLSNAPRCHQCCGRVAPGQSEVKQLDGRAKAAPLVLPQVSSERAKPQPSDHPHLHRVLVRPSLASTHMRSVAPSGPGLPLPPPPVVLAAQTEDVLWAWLNPSRKVCFAQA
ncbi:hypothetical protein ACK3TF_004806 [Chlorella vulgaris]